MCDIRALLLPVPTLAPLLALLGVLACEAAAMISKPCCPSPPVTVGLQLPLFPRAPFLACDLACLVCTVQIKDVSI